MGAPRLWNFLRNDCLSLGKDDCLHSTAQFTMTSCGLATAFALRKVLQHRGPPARMEVVGAGAQSTDGLAPG
jgi:hypothetical protein